MGRSSGITNRGYGEKERNVAPRRAIFAKWGNSGI
jgi:hypothetical protein